MKKSLFLKLPLLIVALGSLSAENSSSLDELKREIYQSNERIDALKKQASLEATNMMAEVETLCAVTDSRSASQAPVKNTSIAKHREPLNESTIYLRGEFLYWRALEDNVDYAIKGQPTNLTNASAIGKYQFARYDWDPAFRVALGYRFRPEFWEVEANYTYFHNEGHDSASGPSTLTSPLLVSTFVQPFSSNGTSANFKAKSSIDLNYHLLNVFVAKRIQYENHLIFKIFAGPSGAWIDQDWTAKYFSANNNETVTVDWDYNAGGMRAGLYADFYMGYGFGLLSQLTFAGYVGSYENKQTIKQHFNNSNTNVVIQDSKLDKARFAWNVQFQIGPVWAKAFDTWGFSLFAGYEISPWFNLHMVNRAEASGLNTGSDGRESHISNGIVTPQGLTMNATVWF